jgi:raffinose/stachyose/melibiose transport system substrate-binding protein
MKRILSLLLMMSLVIALFAACSQNEESTSTNEEATTTEESTTEEAVVEEVKLTLGTNQRDAELELFQALAKKVESENPGLTIEITNYDSAVYRFEKLPAMMSSNTQPDIFVMYGGADVAKYSDTGNLLDLTEFVTSSGLKDKFVTLDDASHNGKIWRLPLSMYAEGFYYNKKLLKELNVEPPKTWDELLSIAEKAKAAGLVPISTAVKDTWVGIMLANQLWVRHAGINASVELGNGTLQWTDPKVLAAFQKYEELVKKGYLTEGAAGFDYGQLAANFLQGKTVFVFDGSWMASTYGGNDSPLKDDIGFIAVPAIANADADQGSVNTANNFGYALSSKMSDAQKKYAFKFMEAIFEDEEVIARTIALSSPPATRVDISGATGFSPVFADILGVINNSTSQFPAFDTALNSDIQATLGEQVQALITGTVTAEQLVEAVQKTTEESLKQ